MMKRVAFQSQDKQLMKKVERILAETVIHRRPVYINSGSWPFIVFGPDEKGDAVIREGTAEQAKIMSAPVYIATVGGPHIPDSEGIPIEELSGGDVPEELAGLKIRHLSPMRPLSISLKRKGPPLGSALSEITDYYKQTDIAIIQTPGEASWALSVIKYLDETDRFFPDPVVADFYSRLGHALTGRTFH